MTDRWIIDVFYVHKCLFMPTFVCSGQANFSPKVDDECVARRYRDVGIAGTSPTGQSIRSQSER